jgi:hypothetical protein
LSISNLNNEARKMEGGGVLSSVEDIWEVLTRTWRWGGVDEEAAAIDSCERWHTPMGSGEQRLVRLGRETTGDVRSGERRSDD